MTTLLCGLFLLTTAAPNGGADGGVPFTAPGGGFSVQFPGKPREEKKTFKGAQGGVEVTLFLVEAKKGGTLGVTYSDAGAAQKDVPLEARLDKAVKEVLDLTKGKLVSE